MQTGETGQEIEPEPNTNPIEEDSRSNSEPEPVSASKNLKISPKLRRRPQVPGGPGWFLEARLCSRSGRPGLGLRRHHQRW